MLQHFQVESVIALQFLLVLESDREPQAGMCDVLASKFLESIVQSLDSV